MGYRLGVDLGTTYTAAAVDVSGRLEMFTLGTRSNQVPSVLFVRPDGDVLVGEAAERRGVTEPTRVVREFKRRIGDTVPLMIGGAPYSPQALTARLLTWVVDAATQRLGEPPESICVTHPANWGPFKRDLLGQAIALAGLTGVDTRTEPEAAAITYASRNRVAAGERVAVYDLGGGTFDAAVLARDEDGFRLLGTPEGVEHLGGIDFDAAVFHHVLTSLGAEAESLDDTDSATVVALARLHRECVDAKEVLSADTEAVIPVVLPGLSTSVRLTRGEFEDMLRPSIGETVAALRRVLVSAGTEADELSAIVLVGGSSRIPLVSEQLSAAFGRPLALDTHPKDDVALGAALRVAPAAPAEPVGTTLGGSSGVVEITERAGEPEPEPVTVTEPLPPVDPGPAQPQEDTDVLAALSSTRGMPPVTRPEPRPQAPVPDRGRPGPRRRQLVTVALLLALLVASLVVVLRDRGGRPSAGASGTTPSLSATSPSPSPSGTPTASPSTSFPSLGLPQSPKALADDVMVVPRLHDNNWDLYTVTSAGTVLKRLTRGPEQDTLPIISWDRRSVVYLHYPTPRTVQLNVIGADGSGARPLFTQTPPGCDHPARPALNAAGDVAVPCIDVASKSATLTLFRLDGTLIRKLDQGRLGDPTFTRDGRSVLYWKNTNAPGEDGGAIFEVSTGGSTPTNITPIGQYRDNDPAASPVADLLVMTRRLGTVAMIWTVGLDPAHRLTRLTSGSRVDQDPDWSPDGTQVAFKRDGRVWVMDATGANAHAVLAGPDPDTAVAWTPR